VENSSQISQLLSELRQFKGLTRKSALGDLLPILGENAYDDAGVLKVGDAKIVVSADGIVEGLVKDDPWLAGFYSVVVNVNDVVAKGAHPLGYAFILSSNSPNTRRQIVKGIKEGLDKYNVKFLKAHTHPDTSYDAVDAAVVGIARRVLSSTTAKPNDSIVVAIDLDGNQGLKSWVRTFDSVMLRTKEQVSKRLEGIIQLVDKKMANACRDISGPGILGTIAMLCESSRVGATVNLEEIPKPERIELADWLMTYPSTGFILTTDKPESCAALLSDHGLTTKTVGTVLQVKSMSASCHNQTELFIDFEKESVFGIGPLNSQQVETGKLDVEELFEADVGRIELLLTKVWSTAFEYPEEWRRKRTLMKEQIEAEMRDGYHYFGIRVHNQLCGVYKALITRDGLFGEHQSVDPDFRGCGLATAMYNQFIEFAQRNNCKKAYVNTLVNQASTLRILQRMGFRERGDKYEQANGMIVQTFEKDV